MRYSNDIIYAMFPIYCGYIKWNMLKHIKRDWLHILFGCGNDIIYAGKEADETDHKQ